MKNEILGRHCYKFNPQDNGGEQVSLVTTMLDNGENVIINQEIELQSYCNSASIKLYGAVLSPDMLRDMANQLESELIKAKAKMEEKLANLDRFP